MTNNGIVRIYLALVAAWFLVVTFQPVVYDETWHAHVAWLNSERGLKPFRDLFEHHMPLLWDVLGLYRVLGFTGPGVLYFGRAIVLLCALSTVLGLYLIGCLTRHKDGTPFPPAMLGIIFFIAADSIALELFVVRPETLSAPLFVWSSLTWIAALQMRQKATPVLILLSGTLFGLAVLASPRFALLGGVFLLTTYTRRPVWIVQLQRLLLLALGFSGVVLSYLYSSFINFNDLRFILSFSALLQNVGAGTAWPMTVLIAAFVAVIPLCIVVLFLFAAKNQYRRQIMTETAYVLIVVALSALVAGKYVYAAAASPIFILIAYFLVLSQNRLNANAVVRDLFFGLTIAVWVLLLSIRLTAYSVSTFLANNSEYTLIHRLDQIHADLAFIPAGEQVLLSPLQHPIAVEDASFYALILLDTPDRLCNAVRRAADAHSLPECDYVADIEANLPYLVTPYLSALATGPKLQRLRKIIETNYVKCSRYYVRLPHDPGRQKVSKSQPRESDSRLCPAP